MSGSVPHSSGVSSRCTCLCGRSQEVLFLPISPTSFKLLVLSLVLLTCRRSRIHFLSKKPQDISSKAIAAIRKTGFFFIFLITCNEARPLSHSKGSNNGFQSEAWASAVPTISCANAPVRPTRSTRSSTSSRACATKSTPFLPPACVY
jgi:hypothetical protein